MELIDRKMAIDQAMGKLDYTDVVFDTATESEIVYMLRSLPSVPAVPLDRLCEFLEKCGADAYCGTCKKIMGECFTDGRGCGSEHFWKELLTKWMEGLDAAESMVQKT